MFSTLILMGLLSLSGSPASANQVVGPEGAKIDAYMQAMESLGFSGVLTIEHKGRLIIDKGYGFANKEKQIPNDSQTAFDIGSITKQFTAAAIMKLEMQGKLNTSDLLSRYFKVGDDKKEITLHHLLTHTAGLINFTGGDYEKGERDVAVAFALEQPLRHGVGEMYRYSNAGYSVLAAIVEKVSGQPYETFLYENLFKPAGIENIGYRRPDWSSRVVSHQYTDKDNGTPLEKIYPSWHLLGNGGMLATGSDMVRWHDALMGDKILSKAAKAKLYKPNLEDYAYGWLIEQSPWGKTISHNGGNDLGIHAELVRYMDRDTVVFIASNDMGQELPFPLFIMQALPKILFENFSPMAPPKTRQAVSPSLSGAYRVADGEVVVKAGKYHALVLPMAQQLMPPSSQGHDVAALNQKAADIMEAIKKGDLDPFLKAISTPDSSKRKEEYLKDVLDWIGGAKRYHIMGSRDAWWGSRKELATFISLEGNKINTVMRFHWDDKGIRGIGGNVIPYPAILIWFPENGTSGTMWDLVSNKPYPLRFEETDGVMQIKGQSPSGEAFTGQMQGGK